MRRRLHNRNPQRRLFRRLRRDADGGSALTEFVIVIPLFIMLLFWAEFFVDLGLLKMKVEEAARFALWETAAQRDVTAIRADLQARFSDLSSPNQITSSTPVGTRSFRSVNITSNIITNLDAPFQGSIQLNWGNNGGLLGNILSGLANFIGRQVDAMLRNLSFETRREARANVEFQVNNTLFPGGRLFTGFLDPEQARTITVRAQSPVMLVDTWKAWPGKFAASSQDVNTDPYRTYSRNGQAAAPEVEVAARMRRVAFNGNARSGLFGGFGSALRFFGLADPAATGHWKDRSGPIAMLPGEPTNQSFSPASGVHVQRFGDRTVASNVVTPMGRVGNNVDRARSTVPSSVIHTWWWTAEGGMDTRTDGPRVAPQFFSPMQNGYALMYQCRDAWYMGSAVAGVKRWANPTANRQAFSRCQ